MEYYIKAEDEFVINPAFHNDWEIGVDTAGSITSITQWSVVDWNGTVWFTGNYTDCQNYLQGLRSGNLGVLSTNADEQEYTTFTIT